MKTRLSIAITAAILSGCGGGGGGSESPSAVSAVPAASPGPTQWPVSLIIARGMSAPFKQCFPHTLTNGTVVECYSGYEQTVVLTSTGGRTTLFDLVFGAGATDCTKTVTPSALPYYAAIGESGIFHQCVVQPFVVSNTAVGSILTSQWSVRASTKPGHVLVCSFHGCYRGDESGNVDLAKFPWANE
jgi:ABC-type Fe3+-hydroxamate transport system substrate-binding protein